MFLQCRDIFYRNHIILDLELTLRYILNLERMIEDEN